MYMYMYIATCIGYNMLRGGGVEVVYSPRAAGPEVKKRFYSDPE